MELWQASISICAGIITIVTLLEKFGITHRFKKLDTDFNEFRKLIAQVADIQKKQQEFGELQKDQNNALLAILRNSLYQSFRDNRDLGVWTDDEASVQTKLHAAYKALHGNGEEEIWWEKKKQWKIVTNEELKKIKMEKCK